MRERVVSPLASGPSSAAVPTADEPARLRLRELTGWEEEYVEQHADDANTARLCNEILARCLVAPGEPLDAARATIRSLLVSERDRELVELRRVSLGADVNAQVLCPACDEMSEVDFSLDVLPLGFESPPRQLEVDVDGVG